MSTNSDRLANDLKTVVRDAEAILRDTADDVSAQASVAREKLRLALQEARETCGDLEARALEGAKVTDRKVRDNPYAAIGVAFGVGVALGVLLKGK